MEASYDVRGVHAVVVHILVIALLLLGGAAFWFGYRALGVMLVAGAAVLLAGLAAGREA